MSSLDILIPRNNACCFYFKNHEYQGFHPDDFQEEKVDRRFRLEEFKEFISKLNAITKVKNRKMYGALIIFICAIFGATGIAIWLLTNPITSTVGYFVAVAGLYSLFMFIVTGLFCYGERRFNSLRMYEQIVAQENLERSHARGIHWRLGPEGSYLLMALNFNGHLGSRIMESTTNELLMTSVKDLKFLNEPESTGYRDGLRSEIPESGNLSARDIRVDMQSDSVRMFPMSERGNTKYFFGKNAQGKAKPLRIYQKK